MGDLSNASRAFKRLHPRFATKASGVIRRLGGNDWAQCQLVNLSKGGACISVMIKFEIGMLVELVVAQEDPRKEDHRLMCKVAWSQKEKYGLQFITRL